MINRNLKIFWTLTILSICLSCAGPKITIKQNTVYENEIDRSLAEYLLGPGDVMEIIYTFETRTSSKPYTLAIGDVVKVEFFYHPEMTRDLSVLPDGKISLPLRGEIFVEGLTPTELGDKLTDLYSDMFEKPVVTITLLQFDQPLIRFKEAIKSDPQGMAKRIRIRPDGNVTFPILEDIKAAGLSVSQLKQIALEKYKEKIVNIDLTIILQDPRSNLVYVLGEVKKPDYYNMDSPTTVTQILSRAGVNFNTAAINSILVVSRNNENKPVGRIFNLEDVLGSGNIGKDFVLRQYDVVFVPKTTIAKANLFIDQYINQIVPNLFRVNLGFSYLLNR